MCCAETERDRRGRCRPGHKRLRGVRPQASDNRGQRRGLPGRVGCGGSQGRPRQAWAVLAGWRLLESAGCSAEGRHAFTGCHAETDSARTGTSTTGDTPPRPAFHTRHTPRNQDTRTVGSKERQVTLWVRDAGQAENLAGARGCLLGKCVKHTQVRMAVVVSGE